MIEARKCTDEEKEKTPNMDYVIYFGGAKRLFTKKAIIELKTELKKLRVGVVSKSNSIEVEPLSAKVFMLANELAIAGYGNAAVKLHTVHNGMITEGCYYSC